MSATSQGWKTKTKGQAPKGLDQRLDGWLSSTSRLPEIVSFTDVVYARFAYAMVGLSRCHDLFEGAVPVGEAVRRAREKRVLRESLAGEHRAPMPSFVFMSLTAVPASICFSGRAHPRMDRDDVRAVWSGSPEAAV